MRLISSKVLLALAALLAGSLGAVAPAQADSYVVSGSVSSSNGPVLRGHVAFFATCEAWMKSWDPRYVSGSGDIDGGTYSANLPPGSYLALIVPAEGAETTAARSWHNNSRRCESAEVITVTSDMTVNLTAQAAFDVSGTIRSRNGPIDGGYVEFFASCTDWENFSGPVDTVAARFDWDYEDAPNPVRYLVNLPPGSYKIRIQPWYRSGAVSSWHSAAPDCSAADPVTVKETATTADLTARHEMTVTGKVLSRHGLIPRGEFSVYWGCAADERSRVTKVFLDNGSYRVMLPAGDYKVQIFPERGWGAAHSWHNAKRTCDAADTLTIPYEADGAVTQDIVATAQARWIPQTVRAPRARIAKRARVTLPAQTNQRSYLKWESKTPRTCRLKGITVTGRRAGTCRLLAIATGTASRQPYRRVFTIRVR